MKYENICKQINKDVSKNGQKISQITYVEYIHNMSDLIDEICEEYNNTYGVELYGNWKFAEVSPEGHLLRFALVQYNHMYPPLTYAPLVDSLKKRGFRVIGVSQMYFEDCMIFETWQEADDAWRDNKTLGAKGLDCDWYSIGDFKVATKEYEKNSDCTVLVHWLENQSSKTIKDNMNDKWFERRNIMFFIIFGAVISSLITANTYEAAYGDLKMIFVLLLVYIFTMVMSDNNFISEKINSLFKRKQK